MNGNGQKAEVDEQRLSRAKAAAFLRSAVAGYLIYLGYTLLRDYLRGSSTLEPWIAWAAGLGFIAAGAAFGVFVWKRYRAAAEEARLPREEEPDGEQPPE